MDLDALKKRAEDLQSKVDDLEAQIKEAEGDDAKALQDQLSTVAGELKDALAEKQAAVQDANLKALGGQVETLRSAIDDLKEEPQEFEFTAGGSSSSAKSPYGDGSEYSFFDDVRNAAKGIPAIRDRLVEAAEANGGDVKAMVEGTDGSGGYLVPPETAAAIAELRVASAPLRGIIPSVQVSGDNLNITRQTAGVTAGWADELAEKASADMTFATVAVSVFTAAGLAVTSNQLLADARPSIDQLIISDLAKRIGILEEIAFINGSGTGQPRGILNTASIGDVDYTDGSPTVSELLPKILEAVTTVQTNGLTDPTHIVMHPAIWNKIIATPAAQGDYVLGATDARPRRAGDPLPAKSLFGYPVVTTFNVPQNLGPGTNQTAIIVGNFNDALILDRQGFTVDDSSHVYFTSNQTVFRGESRVGFTAGRYPSAFCTVTDTGLITASLAST